MKEYHQFYINGSWVDPINGLNKLDVLNPATEEPIGSIALGSVSYTHLRAHETG